MFNALPLKARWCLAAIITAALITGVVLLACGPDSISKLWHAKDLVMEWCRAYPVVLFAALVVLPGLGFPASPLLILAGVIWGSNPASCLAAIAAMILNMSWTYLVAAGPARAIVARLLGRHWERWRNLGEKDRIRLAVLLRVTPGVPLVLQNYLLGLLAVPFRPYILISVPINAAFVIGFVLTSGAVFEGRTGMAITGAAVLVAAILLVRLLRGRFKAAQPDTSAS